MFTLIVNTSFPNLAGLFIAELSKKYINIKVEWKNENLLKINKNALLSSSISICRYLAHYLPEMHLYGSTFLEKVEIDHWISFSIGPLISSQKFKDSIEYLEYALNSLTFLVGHKLTIADLLVWNTLFCNHNWNKLLHFYEYKNIKRWFSYIENLKEVKLVLNSLPDLFLKPKSDKIIENKDEGKFIELPNAKKGEVVVRFPPEASGYLHIGHAKAALLNQYYQELFKGKLIMRFDDTNPEKEKVDYEKVILEDLKLLQIYPDQFTHTSDYFDILLKMCEKLLKENQAYVDDTEPEIMKKEREQRKVSRNRENSVEKNLNMWSEMLKGTEYGQKCCVRAKIDMSNDNGCLRDPTIYRCKNEPHPRTGTKYKVYPTYDFACPIVDSIEGVTHALRTMEYHDRDDQFNWFIEVLNLRKVNIWEYSRLNMMNTVLSKRKLTWFVDEKIVDSWEDPRLPTVRGVVRRGLTIEGLKQFIIAQGSSRTVVQMEWDKIWAFNKKIIDPIAPRYTALKKDFTVSVNVKGLKTEKLLVPKHPKNPSLGTKEIWTGSNLLIEKADAELLKEGDNATFINWGNLKIIKINRDCDGSIESIDAEANLNDTNFKKTLKLTWLTNVEVLTPVEIYYYDHIITKPILGKDEDFKKYVNYNSKHFVNYIGEENLRNLESGEIIQLQRVGFFRCDVPFKSNGKVVLIHIPDGSNKSQLLNYSASSSKTSELPCNFKENEKLFLKNKFIDYKSLPVSNQELEQIAIQWRSGRENSETQKKVQVMKEKKKNDQGKKENKKTTLDNIYTEKIGIAKTSRTRLGLEATKEDNLAEWYSQVITKSELIEYYDVSGCYILRPWSFALWEVIQNFLDKEIKSLGVQNCYFPIFVTKSVLEREKTHIADFAPEVAWVTKSGVSDLAECIAIRPTSETVMYPAFAKWIQSYRDLPIKLNQWNNVVRWEFKHPQPFLRTREFLWQEGHTAYSSAKEAQDEVYKVLDIYSRVYEDLLAVPIIKGWKTKKEKFAGSDFTTTVEAFVPASGRGIQAATSHHLGQNFSKMFDIVFEDPDTREKKFVFQNSWGLTTRSLGIMIMVHSDNKGLVLPPNAAAIQTIIIPCGITVNLKEEEKNNILTACKTFEFDFCKAGILAKFDDRTNYSPGWKFNHWELKGVPVRIELGPKDYEKRQFVAVRRDSGEKKILDFDNKVENVKKLLNEIQENMFRKAEKELNDHMIQSKNWNDFCSALDKKNIILAPFCEEETCEDNIKKDSERVEEIETGAPAMGAKSLCIPFDQPSVIQNGDNCIHPKCKNKPIRYTLFGRSY